MRAWALHEVLFWWRDAGCSIGALIIGTGFGVVFYYNGNKEP